MTVYIGMFGFVAKAKILSESCDGKDTVEILEIIKKCADSDKKKYMMIDVDIGDTINLDSGFLFNSKKLAIAYAENSKKLVPKNWSGNSLLGLPF